MWALSVRQPWAWAIARWATEGCYHWWLAQPRPLWWPVLALGGPGLWELSPAVSAAVARLLPDEAVRTGP